MLSKCLMLGAAALLLTASTAGAQRWIGYDRHPHERFGAPELTFDAFGTYADPRRAPWGKRDGTWGGGVGANYFFTRHVGLGAETYFEDRPGRFFDHMTANVIGRWPLDDIGLAPYVLGGGSRRWSPTGEWTGHLGGGLEYRFLHNLGIFADGRHVFRQKTSDHYLVRAGVRFAF
jgi:hypothetical protein